MFRFKSLLRSLAVWFGVIAILSISLASAFASEKPEIFVQMGHTSSRVNSVAFSPDGKYALSGSWDKTIKQWDIASGREVRTFYGTAKVTSIAISLSGKYVISGDEDRGKNLKLWDMASGKRIRTFSGDIEIQDTDNVVFSPDGKYVLSGGKNLKLWDIASGKELRTFRNDNKDHARITSIVISPDGKHVITGSGSNVVVPMSDGTMAHAKSSDYTIRIWDIVTGRQIKAFNKGKGWVEAIAISPDGKHVISGDFEDSARMWDIATGRQVKAFNVEGVSSIAISPDGKYALFGGVMNIRLWDIAKDREIRTFSGHSGWVRSVAFSPDGKYALSGSDDKAPKLWDIASGKELRSFGGYTQQVASVSVSSVGKKMLIGQEAGLLNLWDISTGRQIKTIKHTLGVRAAIISRDGTLAAAGGWDFPESSSTIKLWNIATGREIQTLRKAGEGRWSHPLAISPDNKSILWSVGSALMLSDIATGKEMKTYRGHKNDEIKNAMMSANGKYAISVGIFELNVWDVASGKAIKTFHDKNGGLKGTLSSDGKNVLLMNYDNKDQPSLRIWDIPTNREISQSAVQYGAHTPTGWSESLTLSHDGRFALWSEKLTLYLCEISTGKVLRTFAGHVNQISSIGISPNDKYVYSGGYDGTARLWDISTGKEIAQLISFKDGEWIVITPEGYFNASPNGAKHLNVRVGNNVYSIDNFYEKFFNPVYVASVLQGKKVEAVADIRKGILTPPDVKIISPEPNKEFSADTITITISAKDTGGGIDEIRLYHNGKAIGEDTRAVKIVPKGNEAIKIYTVTLLDGANTFRATAFSKDRTESNPYELIVRLTAPQKDVSMYVFAVGINKYKNPALNLNYAEPDAKGIADFFRQKGKGLFKNVEIRDIYNEQATKETIISKLKQLENTNPQDAVLIYLAGHGENINDKWYFIPHELTYPEREADVKAKGISSDELSGHIKNIKAQKILLLIDACKSGAVLIAFRGFEDRKALSQLSRSTGVHIIAASTKDQFAAEVKELGHGVFTYILLEGLKGKAAGGSETVTVRKLMGYVEERLPDITKKYKQEAQYPVVDSRGMDFPLVVAK
jgi:WD40 repeat protein